MPLNEPLGFDPEDREQTPTVQEQAHEVAQQPKGFFNRYNAAVRAESTADNLTAALDAQGIYEDPSFVLDEKTFDGLMKDLPEDYDDRFVGARSLKHAELIRTQLLREMENERQIGGGVSGFAIRMLAGITDPVFLATGGIGAGAGALTRGTRAVRAARAAAASGALSAAQETAIASGSQLRGTEDIVYAGIAGFLFGGALGGAVPSAKAAAGVNKRFDENTIRTGLQDADQPVAKQYTDYNDDGTPTVRDASDQPDFLLDDVDTSVGAAQVEGVGLDRDLASEDSFKTLNERFDLSDEEVPTSAFAKARFSALAQSGSSDDPAVRAMTFALNEEPVGFTDRGVTVPHGAKEIQQNIHRTAQLRVMEPHLKAFTADSKEKGRWFGKHNLVARAAYSEDVGLHIRGAKTGNEHVAASAGAYRKGFDDYLKLWKENNSEIADVAEDANWLPRKVNRDGLRELSDTYGTTGLDKVVFKGIRKARPDLEEADQLLLARGLLDRYREMAAGIDHGVVHGIALDDVAVMHDIIKRAAPSIKKADLEAITERVTKRVNKAGQIDHAKQRVQLDESVSVKLTNKKTGNVDTVRLAQLFENNVETLFTDYSRAVSGDIALRQKGFGGGTAAARDNVMKMVRVRGESRTRSPDGIENDAQNLGLMLDDIAGRPLLGQNPSSPMARASRRIRDYNFIRFMQQTGWAQVAELGNIIAEHGLVNTIRHVPAMGGLIRKARTGKIDRELAEQLTRLTGAGVDDVINPASLRIEDVGTDIGVDTRINKLDVALEGGKKFVSETSGMGALTRLPLRLTQLLMHEKMMKIVHGTAELPESELFKFRQLGIDKRTLNKIKTRLRRYTSKNEDGDDIIDEAGWSRKDPETFDKYVLMLQRHARRVIQENDPANLAKWMHSDIGRVITQFRTFSIVAHEKQLLNSLHAGAVEAYMRFQWQASLAALAYVGQTYLNYAGDEKKLKERLSMEAIAKRAAARAGSAALLPGAVDSLANLTTGEPFFDARTTGLPSDALRGIPTVATGDQLLGVLGMGKNVRDDHRFSKSDYHNLRGLLPLLNNFHGMSNVHRALTEDLPNQFKRDF